MSDYVAQDEAAQTAAMAALFHNGIDVLMGVGRQSQRPMYYGTGGVIGAGAQSAGGFIGSDGLYYPRATHANATLPPEPAGFVLTPGMLLLAGLAFLILRK